VVRRHSEILPELLKSVGVVRESVANGGLVAAAEAQQVWSEQGSLPLQRGPDLLPVPRARGESMQQRHVGPFAAAAHEEGVFADREPRPLRRHGSIV